MKTFAGPGSEMYVLLLMVAFGLKHGYRRVKSPVFHALRSVCYRLRVKSC